MRSHMIGLLNVKKIKTKRKYTESAFRALNLTMPQNVPANTFVKAVFPTEQFDLANEYNPITSTFRPKKMAYIPSLLQLDSLLTTRC